MIRQLTATACLALALTGCTTDPFGDGDGKRIKTAVQGLFGELERADYAAAASHWCAYEPPASPPTAPELQTSFSGLPRPWKTKLVSSRHTPDDGTGVVNLTLTDGAGTEHDYNVDFILTDGPTKVCDVDTGTVHIDVEF